MSTLSVFDFKGHAVRILGTPDRPLWVAQDVCDVLGVESAASSTRTFDSDEKDMHDLHTLGGVQKTLVVTEPGLYRLIFKSKKSSAKEFQRWVFHVVLPEIRKTGKFTIQPTVEHPEPKMIADSVNMVLSIAGINPNLIAGVAANAVADYYPALKPAMELVKKELPIAIEEKLVTVTDLAAVYSDRVGRKVTAQAMNKLLQEAGLQEPTGSKNPAWQPTVRGAEFGQVILNTAKGHDRTVQQLRWYPSVIDQLAS